MGKIAWGRVFLGGLVAGTLWWIFEGLVHGMMLGQDWMAAMTALGKTKEQMDAGRMHFMALVTAACLLASLINFAMALWPTKLTCIPLVTSFFESIVATTVGGWLYREA